MTWFQGERGKLGDHGQDGRPGPAGDQGKRGATGPAGPSGTRGIRGRGLSLMQALAMFLLITIIGVTLSLRLERQQDVIRSQQAQINQAQYQRCVDGVKILELFNAQQRRLIGIEVELRDDPSARPAGRKAAGDRVEAYTEAIVPIPTCVRR